MKGQIEQRGLSPFETAALRPPQGDGSESRDPSRRSGLRDAQLCQGVLRMRVHAFGLRNVGS